MDNFQTEVLFKWIVVSIVVKQCVSLNETERCNETIDRSSNGPPNGAKSAIVCGRFNRKFNGSCLVDFEPQQFSLNGIKLSVCPNSL